MKTSLIFLQIHGHKTQPAWWNNSMTSEFILNYLFIKTMLFYVFNKDFIVYTNPLTQHMNWVLSWVDSGLAITSNNSLKNSNPILKTKCHEGPSIHLPDKTKKKNTTLHVYEGLSRVRKNGVRIFAINVDESERQVAIKISLWRPTERMTSTSSSALTGLKSNPQSSLVFSSRFVHSSNSNQGILDL